MDRPKYRIEIFWSDEDGGYIANVPDLAYCSAFGESYEEALREVLVAMDLHLDTLRELDRPIPQSGPQSVVGTLAGDPEEPVASTYRWEATPESGSPRYGPAEVERALSSLDPVEEWVLRFLYLEGFSYEDAAKELGTSVAHVRRTREMGLRNLRLAMGVEKRDAMDDASLEAFLSAL